MTCLYPHPCPLRFLSSMAHLKLCHVSHLCLKTCEASCYFLIKLFLSSVSLGFPWKGSTNPYIFHAFLLVYSSMTSFSFLVCPRSRPQSCVTSAPLVWTPSSQHYLIKSVTDNFTFPRSFLIRPISTEAWLMPFPMSLSLFIFLF